MRPVLFRFGPFQLYGYGALVVLGGVVAFLFARARREKAGLRTDDDYWLFVNAILLGGIVGGRVLFILEYATGGGAAWWRQVLAPSGGFSVLGAFAGVPLALWLMCRRRGLDFLRILDLTCVMAPMWHVFGRFGCLLAGCCQGKPTSLPWAIVFRDPGSMIPPELLGVPLHPAQMYEAGADALLALLLYRLLVRTEDRRPGLVAAAYFAAYGALRFGLEFVRGDTVPFALGLTAGQALGLGLIVGGAALASWRKACSPSC